MFGLLNYSIVKISQTMKAEGMGGGVMNHSTTTQHLSIHQNTYICLVMLMLANSMYYSNSLFLY